VQIDQAFKSLLFAAGKQLVDRTFFIGFEMVFEKGGAQVVNPVNYSASNRSTMKKTI
jgi:hypothetical protein